jgi:magnesium-transporting ATPase (P-type)
MSIDGVPYGDGITEIGKAAWKLLGKPVPEIAVQGEALAKLNAQPHVSFYSDRFENDYRSNIRQKLRIRGFFRALALCHDVITEKLDSGTRSSASNPDDEALVAAAAYFGYQFKDRIDKKVILNVSDNPPCTRILKYLKTDSEATAGTGVEMMNNAMLRETKEDNSERETEYNIGRSYEEQVEILETIEFSSKRRRMSVIVREGDGTIKLYCKGADSVMFDRMRPYKRVTITPNDPEYANSTNQLIFNDKGNLQDILTLTEQHIQNFSIEGLRCLVVGYVDIPESKFHAWQDKYRVAKSDIIEIDKKKAGIPNDIEKYEDEIETGLSILGATAIEDKLQDGVPETIATFAQAGML